MEPIPFKDVVDLISSSGRWGRYEEWRISTITSTEIERTKESEAFRVRVECDFVLEAYCPTITRAIEVASAYERVVQQLLREIGWPGWASKNALEPAADAV